MNSPRNVELPLLNSTANDLHLVFKPVLSYSKPQTY